MKSSTTIASVISCFFVSCLSAYAEAKDKIEKVDSVSVLQRITENKSVYANFFTLPYENPAMRYGMYRYTLNEISVGGEYRHEDEPLIMQTGDGYRYGAVDVKSFIRKNNSSMWGEASYRNGKQMNMQWNETSDYLLLYPYVMGDTVKGNLKSEQYFFNGGYSANAGKIIWGSNASYRATIGYRQTDPRPRNITGKFDFTFGIALTGVGGYRPGLSVNATKYKQKNDIKFYNDQGNAMLYHLTGMGTDYYRFRGEEKETYYKGRIFGGSLNLLPEDYSGFTVDLSFNNFLFEKIISSLNELPMAKVNEYTWRAETGYRKKQMNRAWGVKAELANIHRKGTENIFGDPANNIYSQIASVQQYSNKQTECRLSGFYEHTGRYDFNWSISPSVGFGRMGTKYIYPARKQKNERIYSALVLRADKKMGDFLVRAKAEACYDASLNAELQLPAEVNEKTLVPLLSDYRFLDSDHTLMKLELRADYAFTNRCAFYLSACWQRGWYTERVRTDAIQAVCGIAF